MNEKTIVSKIFEETMFKVNSKTTHALKGFEGALSYLSDALNRVADVVQHSFHLVYDLSRGPIMVKLCRTENFLSFFVKWFEHFIVWGQNVIQVTRFSS